MTLANDYLGYFVTPEERLEGGYEICASFYGDQEIFRLKQAPQNITISP
jgi:hypothetical protein